MESGGNRAEAERWLYTANKLLSARDLHAARSFAIRARESDPTFGATELLITLIDTLVVGEARINDHLHDWYGVLQTLRFTQNIDCIATHYRRLALLLDPHRNPFAFSDHAFSLVHDAWSVLSNAVKKAMYDNELRLLTEPPPPPVPVPSPAPFPMISPQRQNQNQNHQHQHEQQQLQHLKRGRVAEEERPSQNNNVAESTPQSQPQPQLQSRNSESTGTPSPSETEGRSFWTACPYCYVMYEYPKIYEECTLRCQSCRRGFHAVMIRSPSLTEKGDSTSFCSWGFFPLGFSGNFKDISGSSSKWNPFSPLFPCPLKAPSKRGSRKGPWVFYDDEAAAAFVELSDPSEEDSDDGDWRNGNRKGRKRRRNVRRRSYAAGSGDVRTAPIDRPRRGNHVVAAVDANVDAADGGSAEVPNAVRPESGKKAALGSLRKKGAGNLGKLDLNVEFSYEVEEPAPEVSEGNGNGNGNAEDNIEGIGFFEGLDEFLSSLPILNVVADDKVKGH